MRYSTIAIAIFLLTSGLLQAQNQNALAFKEKSQSLSGEYKRISGFLDGIMPVELFYTIGEDAQCLGFIKMPGNREIQLEGECQSDTLALYEFDEYSRMTGVFHGKIEEPVYQLKWSNPDFSKSYYLEGSSDQILSDVIDVYLQKEGDGQLLMWKDHNYISNDDNINRLAWSYYRCPQAKYACLLDHRDGLEEQSLSISDKIISVGSELYHLSEQVNVHNELDYGHDYFYAYRYPKIGDESLEKYLKVLVENQLALFRKSIPPKVEEAEPKDRWQHRGIGDFYLTLVTPEIISGFLFFHSSDDTKVKTQAFSYNRSRKEFIDLRAIWKRSFNFSYFLKTTIENEKRTLIKPENAIVKKILLEDKFTHFALSPMGLLFFSDYNVLFGRRAIVLPYKDVGSFITDKSILQLIEPSN